MQTGLDNLIEKNTKAAEYYYSLHTSVRAAVDRRAADIITQEDLIAVANRSMTELLGKYRGIYDDSSNYPEEQQRTQ